MVLPPIKRKPGAKGPGPDGRATPPSNATRDQACLLESAIALIRVNKALHDLVPGYLLGPPLEPPEPRNCERFGGCTASENELGVGSSQAKTVGVEPDHLPRSLQPNAAPARSNAAQEYRILIALSSHCQGVLMKYNAHSPIVINGRESGSGIEILDILSGPDDRQPVGPSQEPGQAQSSQADEGNDYYQFDQRKAAPHNAKFMVASTIAQTPTNAWMCTKTRPCSGISLEPYLQSLQKQIEGSFVVTSFRESYQATSSARSNFHQPFLERAGNPQGQASGQHCLGAFLTLRLVDQFAAPHENFSREATAYQIKATAEYLQDLHPQTSEVKNLREIVRLADAALKEDDPRLLFSPLLAFAYSLEDDLRLDEALDVLETTIHLGDGRDGDHEVATLLQKARVLRLSGYFYRATEAYSLGGDMAARIGDYHTERLSRVGRAIVMQKTGDLAQSEKTLREIWSDCVAADDVVAEAHCCQDLGVALHLMKRTQEAVPLLFRAFQLYEAPMSRARALSDTGVLLKELGYYTAAGHAFTLVLSGNPPLQVRVRTALEMIELSSVIVDRISFERWRKEVSNHLDSLPPDDQVDFEFKVGTGLSQFGTHAKAEQHLIRGIELAERYGLGERLFRIEDALACVREHRACVVASAELPASEIALPELHTTIQELKALEAM